MSDLAVAADDAHFANYQMRIGFAGFAPHIAMMALLTLGPKRYREWYVMGRAISAEKALEWGVVNEIVPKEKLEERALQWARAVAAHSTDGLMIGKTVTHVLYDLLGMHGSFTASNIAHPLFTNVKWREDEFNFLKVRSEKGAGEAFRLREEIWGKQGF
jgi:enoyl-CoA hydratase